MKPYTLISLLLLMTTGACTGAPKESAMPAAPAAESATLGTVTGQIPNAAAGAIVVLVPKDDMPMPAPAVQPSMDQIQMTFVPDLLVARAGYPVAFRSNDTELHNINVRHPDKVVAEFNRSIPPGVTFEHTFTEPGYYDVRCDIHPAMSASIFVAASPFAQPAAGGAFQFDRVPPGDYTLTIYNGPAVTERPLTVAAGANPVAD